MKRAIVRFVLLACTLNLTSYVAATSAGVEDLADSGQQQARQELGNAASELNRQVENLKSPDVKTAARKFVQAAGRPDEVDLLKRVTDELDTALASARRRAEQQRQNFSEGDAVKAVERAIRASRTLTSATPNVETTANTQKNVDTTSNSNNTGTNRDRSESILPAWAWTGIAGVAALGLLAVAVFVILRMRRGYWARFDHHVGRAVKANTAELMQRQDELAKHFVALGNQHRSGSARLESIEGELQALGRRARAMSDGRGYQSDSSRNSGTDYSRPQPPPVEPEFPASVDEYLNKMKRNSTVVKPDFQNGILVSDLDGRGELVLVRDTRLADGAQPLFLVPRVGQFQTKQEFHSYYERYYECQRPSAGDVWIIDPAVVSIVPGGWQLREKGVLEVR